MRLVPARLEILKPGSIVCADKTIPCIEPGPQKVLIDSYMPSHECLYVPCYPFGSPADHYLDGQLRPDGTLTGVWVWEEVEE